MFHGAGGFCNLCKPYMKPPIEVCVGSHCCCDGATSSKRIIWWSFVNEMSDFAMCSSISTIFSAVFHPETSLMNFKPCGKLPGMSFALNVRLFNNTNCGSNAWTWGSWLIAATCVAVPRFKLRLIKRAGGRPNLLFWSHIPWNVVRNDGWMSHQCWPDKSLCHHDALAGTNNRTIAKKFEPERRFKTNLDSNLNSVKTLSIFGFKHCLSILLEA